MSDEKTMLRREVLRGSLKIGLAVIGVGALGACSKASAFKCDDTLGLPPSDIEMRKNLKYVDASPDPAKVCSVCQQYQPGPNDAACGTCKLFKGTVHPKGNCTSFAAKS
jgi:hypothetical protein